MGNISRYTKFVVTYNEPFKGDLNAVTTIDDFVAGIPESIGEGLDGEIAIYYPQNALSDRYDVIVVVRDRYWSGYGMIGYDLKEERKLPDCNAPSDAFTHRVVIRSDSTEIVENLSGWTVPSKEEISSFFGASGKDWTPERWRALNDSHRSSR